MRRWVDRLLCAICGGAQDTIGYMGQQILRPKFSGRSVPAETLYCILRYEYVAGKETIMAATAERKEHPISMRLPEADVAIIDRAAGLRGRSRTDFVRDAAVRAAEEVIMEQGLIRMSSAGFADFLNVLARPAMPVPEMVKLVKRPAPWEFGQGTKR